MNTKQIFISQQSFLEEAAHKILNNDFNFNQLEKEFICAVLKGALGNPVKQNRGRPKDTPYLNIAIEYYSMRSNGLKGDYIINVLSSKYLRSERTIRKAVSMYKQLAK